MAHLSHYEISLRVINICTHGTARTVIINSTNLPPVFVQSKDEHEKEERKTNNNMCINSKLVGRQYKCREET